jgi:hypothetical protein
MDNELIIEKIESAVTVDSANTQVNELIASIDSFYEN